VTASALVGINALLDRGQLEEAAEEVRRLWSSAREPALAELLEGFPSRARPRLDDDGSGRSERWLHALREADALMMPAMLAELDAMLAEQDAIAIILCFRALASRPGDPRVSAACVRWLLDPAKVHSLDAPMYRELDKVLNHHLDPRHAETLRAFARSNKRWAERIGRTTTLPVLARLLSYPDRPRRSMPPELVKRLAQLRERVRQMPDEVARPSIASGEARVRSHPSDEGARGVFRDMLLEAGDAWGELMALQEARAAKGETRPSPAEAKLLLEAEARILGTLSLKRPGMVVPLEYGRGFLTHAAIRGHAHEVAPVMAHSELSTLERVTFYDAAAITPNLTALKEAHGITLADLERATLQAPGVKLSVVTIKNATPAALARARWWPELRELYTLDPGCRLEQLLALPVSKQLTALGIIDRPAKTAFDGFKVALLAMAPDSIQRVRLDAYARHGGLRVTWLRAEPGWRAEVVGTTMLLPRGDREAAGDLHAALPALRRYLSGARSITVSHGVSPQLRHAIERR